MLRKVENLQSSVPVESFSFAHIIMKWWKSLTRNVAYKLLNIAQTSNDTERLKALYTLTSLNLKGIFLVCIIYQFFAQIFFNSKFIDWHYQHIAQMLDAKTAVSLARMPNVDLRFFLQPPYHHVQYKLHVCIYYNYIYSTSLIRSYVFSRM